MTWIVGRAITFDWTVELDDVLTDATVTLVITLPDGSTVSPTVNHPGTGTYQALYVPTMNGSHRYDWLATGAAQGADWGIFAVGGLATLDEFKNTIQWPAGDISNDVELQSFLDAATPVVEHITGPIAPRTVSEQHSGRGGALLALRKRPLIAVSSVVEYLGATAYELTEVDNPGDAGSYTFTVDRESGTLTRRDAGGIARPFEYGTDNVHVTYTAGFVIVPENILRAALAQAAHFYQATQQGGRPGFRGNPSSGGNAATGFGYGVSYFVRQTLEPHERIPGIA